MSAGVFSPAASVIGSGGQSIIALYGPLLGGFITNPASAADQGLSEPEYLYVDFTGPAALGVTGTTIALAPGQSVQAPSNLNGGVSVNAASSGHRFSAVSIQPPPQFPPTPIPSTFPPDGPTSLTSVLPSYLYQQYADDQNLQSFVDVTNEYQQSYVDWFNDAGLPVYTGLSGYLLDLVGQNLYGIFRPTLSSGSPPSVGPFNTYLLNSVPFNDFTSGDSPSAYTTNDDYYKRIITWAFYKDDGKVFSIPWLKRRLKRFIIGMDGSSPNIDETYDISVTFGIADQVNIGLATYSPILQEAIQAGVLELPFQFTWVVTTP